ncbi:hypothetical protein DEA8626_03009 [Defluviimonas aquaemixtae]|uniref:Uncharacterized protein n=1 Tax=Albidovulum aquaemixtae TaxID=1542388 RepID=A0A2R8BKJ7_9RHOB|nr:hypothetical protein DEA8626_03009 [Defluviimonas aquaemixtae]
MRQLIWAPLEEGGALEGVSQVTVCTMGAFHNLPVASGAPEGLTVRSAGALPIFALSRGLYAAPGNEARVPSRWLWERARDGAVKWTTAGQTFTALQKS